MKNEKVELYENFLRGGFVRHYIDSYYSYMHSNWRKLKNIEILYDKNYPLINHEKRAPKYYKIDFLLIYLYLLPDWIC